MADAAVLLTPQLSPVCYNRSFAEATGLRPRKVAAELVERSVFDLLGNTDKSDAKHAQEALRSGVPIHLGEMDVLNASGDRFVMMQSFLPIADEAGGAVGVVAVFRDHSNEARVQLRYKELLRLEQARAEELENRVAERTQQLSAALEEVTRLSTYDPLTKLCNRRAFDDKARSAWQGATDGSGLAVMICDLDHFKRVNDEYGHQAGDRVLVATAEALVASVRPTDVVARFGGEEFVVLLTGALDGQHVARVAERCAEAIRALPIPALIPGAARRQTISIGVMKYAEGVKSIDEMIANADKALYEAKRTGRDRVVFFGEASAERPKQNEDVKPRLLLVDPDERRARALADRLAECYSVVSSPNGIEALRCCARQPFDVILSEEDTGSESGISFLRKSFAFAPHSARVLVLGSADAYLAIRATNVGRVDQLLLRDDSESHLIEALEHARLKLDLAGTKRLGGERQAELVAVPQLEGLQAIMRTRDLPYAYQPIVRSEDGQRIGFEAYARPETPGFLTPKPNPLALLEVAERMGALWELGRIGRVSICRDITALPSVMLVFINLHITELANEQLYEHGQTLRHANRVVFEIAESAVIRDGSRFREQIGRLRGMGYRVAVDGVGASYAGLEASLGIEANFLKIDMALTRSIERWQIKQRLVKSIIDLADQNGIQVIAKGVETAEEAATLIELGCRYQQGFYYGRPRPLSSWSEDAA